MHILNDDFIKNECTSYLTSKDENPLSTSIKALFLSTNANTIIKNINTANANVYQVAELIDNDSYYYLIYSDVAIQGDLFTELIDYYKKNNTVNSAVSTENTKFCVVFSVAVSSTTRSKEKGVDIYEFKHPVESTNLALSFNLKKGSGPSELNTLTASGLVYPVETDELLLFDSNIGHTVMSKYKNNGLLNYVVFENPNSRFNTSPLFLDLKFNQYYANIQQFLPNLIDFIQNPNDLASLSKLPLLLQLPLISASLNANDFGAAVLHGTLHNVKTHKDFPHNLNNALHDLCYIYSFFHAPFKFALMSNDIGILQYGAFIQEGFKNPNVFQDLIKLFNTNHKSSAKLTNILCFNSKSQGEFISFELLYTRYVFN